jgi:hypothetical protein
MLDQTQLTLNRDAMAIDLLRPDGPRLSLCWHDGLSVESERRTFPNRSVVPAVTRLRAHRYGTPEA